MGHLFKGIALGNLYMFWQSFPDAVSPAGTASFTDREAALEIAVANLETGRSVLGTVPADFQSNVLGTSNFDLQAVLNAYLARYYSFLGEHDSAVTAADRALSSSKISEWTFETSGGNNNPMFLETVEEPATYKPLDNFGIDPDEYEVPESDGRKAFFLSPSDQQGESSRLPVEAMLGFFAERTSPIPVFLPGEMHLIKAEAYARSDDFGPAISALNAVRTKTDDPWGVNAGLPAYDGPSTRDAILNDVYLNRRVELFLIGTSLEDSRRFARPIQSSPPDFESFDRNRNFYPYPDNERANNPNTPGDPQI
jgi:tetratricopeptide (TPR) repeat protein